MYLEALCLELPKYKFENLAQNANYYLKFGPFEYLRAKSFEMPPVCFCFCKKALQALHFILVLLFLI